MKIRQTSVLQVKKTNTATNSASSVKKEKKPSKIVSFVWFGPDVTQNEQMQTTIERLQHIMPCALSTNNYDECEQWLTQYKGDRKIFLIVSNKFGKEIVPHVHLLPSIHAIYVYCTDRRFHTKWTENYPKVQNVIRDANKLTRKLSMDVKNVRRTKNLNSQRSLRKLHSSHAESSSTEAIEEETIESQTGVLTKFQFFVIDISKRLNRPASAMLKSLVSMTENSIHIRDDIPVIDFDELLKKTTFFFVSSELAATMEVKPAQTEAIFILETDANKVNHRERFETGEDLIFELADKIYYCYSEEASQYRTSGDTMTANSIEEQAKQIYSNLKKAYKSVTESEGTIIA